MKTIAAVSCFAVLALTMLLPVIRAVNTGSVNPVLSAQGVPPPPFPPGGGH